MIGKNLRKIRLEKKLSELQVSKKSGVARGYICELESGKYKNPGVIVVCNICKALVVTPNDLIPKEFYTKEE